MKPQEILEKIYVSNWYLGKITAALAWATNATLSSRDIARVRRALAKHGYKCNCSGGIIHHIYKPN